MENQSIGIIGAGYVGLVSAVCLAEKNYKVFLYEKDESKRRILRSGKVLFFEPGLEEIFNQTINRKIIICESLDKMIAQPKLKIIFSCLPTPENIDGSCNTSFIENAFGEIAKIAKNNLIIINKSTIAPQTCEKLQVILSKNKNEISLIHSPEFLRQGNAIFDYKHPSRIIFGMKDQNEKIKDLLLNLTKEFISPSLVFFTDWITAEIIKYAANSYLACRINFINQIFRLATKLNADMKMIKKGIGLDPRIGEDYFNEGAGFGGSCLPKDLSALIKTGQKIGVDVKILEANLNFNEEQSKWFFDQWKESQKITTFQKTTVVIPTLAFKDDTSDQRKSVKIKLLKELQKKNPAGIILCHKKTTGKDWQRSKKKFGLRKKRQASKTIILNEQF